MPKTRGPNGCEQRKNWAPCVNQDGYNRPLCAFLQGMTNLKRGSPVALSEPLPARNVYCVPSPCSKVEKATNSKLQVCSPRSTCIIPTYSYRLANDAEVCKCMHTPEFGSKAYLGCCCCCCSTATFHRSTSAAPLPACTQNIRYPACPALSPLRCSGKPRQKARAQVVRRLPTLQKLQAPLPRPLFTSTAYAGPHPPLL